MSSNGKKLVLLFIFISAVFVFDFGQNLILQLKFLSGLRLKVLRDGIL